MNARGSNVRPRRIDDSTLYYWSRAMFSLVCVAWNQGSVEYTNIRTATRGWHSPTVFIHLSHGYFTACRRTVLNTRSFELCMHLSLQLTLDYDRLPGKMDRTLKNIWDVPWGGFSLNLVPSGAVSSSLSGLNDKSPASARAVTISGEVTNAWVAGFASFRPVKFRLYEDTMVFRSPFLVSWVTRTWGEEKTCSTQIIWSFKRSEKFV